MYKLIVKYVPNIFHIAKYRNVSHDFRHILSYKRALYVTISLKWKKKILTKIKGKMKIIIFFSNKILDPQPTQPDISTP